MQSGIRFALTGLLFVLPLSVVAQSVRWPAHSVWQVNTAASNYPGKEYDKADQVEIVSDTDQWLSLSDNNVDQHGKPVKRSWSGPQDGTMKPYGDDGSMAGFRWENGVHKSRWRMADGSSMDCTFALSQDGRKTTQTCDVKEKDGKKRTDLVVYDRIE